MEQGKTTVVNQGLTEEQEKALAGLMLDDEWPSSLSEWLSGVNVFDVLKLTGVEIRHSNMLAWLLDPSESHGLGTAFLDCFIKKVVKGDCENGDDKGLRKSALLMHDWGNSDVQREWSILDGRDDKTKDSESQPGGAQDILIESKANDGYSYVLAIENKIGAKDGKGQLAKYEKSVVDRFFNDERRAAFENRTLLVYLTPNGDKPVNASGEIQKDWICLSYAKIYEMLVDVLALDVPMRANARMLIQDYATLVKTKIMENVRREEKCTELYLRHKTAFDVVLKGRNAVGREVYRKCEYAFELIREHADKTGLSGRIRNMVAECLEDVSDNPDGGLVLTGGRKGAPSWLSFQSRKMNAVLPALEDKTKGSWSNGDVYYYWFEVRREKEEGKKKLVLGFDMGVLGVANDKNNPLTKMAEIIEGQDALKGKNRLHRAWSVDIIHFRETDEFNEDFKQRLRQGFEQSIRELRDEEEKWIKMFNAQVKSEDG